MTRQKFKRYAPIGREATLYRQWTNASRACYKNHCDCSRCDLDYICKKQAKDNPYNMVPMKYAVLKLMEKFGKP